MFDKIINYFQGNSLANDFDSLIARKDIDGVMSKMDSRAEETEEALKEYRIADHKINERVDKIIVDKDGNYKRTIKRWKLPIDYPKFINEIALVFIYGQPVRWGQTSKGTDDAFNAFTNLLKEVHFDAKVRQCKRYAGAETQSAMLFRVFKNKQGKPDCQIRVLAKSKGDGIYSRWDIYGNLLSFGWEYYLKDGDDTYRHFDLYTDKVIYRCKAGKGGWDVTPEENLIGKIPVILFQQQKEWAGVEPLIEREEYIASKTADVNDYFCDPILVLDADIVKNLPDKDDENKTLIKQSGASTQAAAGYLTWDSASASKQNELEWLQKQILSKTFTPDITFEQMKGLSNVSGKALKQMMVLSTIKASKHKETHDEMMDRVAGLCLSIIGNVLNVSLKKQCDNAVITHEFSDPFGEDATEILDQIAKAKDGGFLSQESAVEQSPTTKNVKTEMERLKADAEAAQAAQMNLFGQMANVDEGVSEGEMASAE